VPDDKGAQGREECRSIKQNQVGINNVQNLVLCLEDN